MDTEKKDNYPCICDMHSHILPGIDDGCKSVEESISVLKECTNQEISKVFLTPHYYSDMPVNDFIVKRQKSYSDLKAQIREGLPLLMLGAEVAYRNDIINREGLERLTYGETNYILIEMPFERWSKRVLNDIKTLKFSVGLEPVIAHVERYFQYQPMNILDQLKEIGAHIQMNSEYLIEKNTSRKAKKLIKKGYIDFLGSDCHGYKTRTQTLRKAFEVLEKDRMTDQINTICLNSNDIFYQSSPSNS